METEKEIEGEDGDDGVGLMSTDGVVSFTIIIIASRTTIKC